MNILVTGGAGFIGSNIVDKYIEKGFNVIILDNLSNGKKANFNPSAKFYNADLYKGDIDFIFNENKIEIINHHAAQIDLRASVENPVFDAQQNIVSSLNLFQSAAKHNVKKIIYASTGGAVYGEQEYFPADEKHKTSPVSPYGISKLTVEKYLDFFKNFYGINYVCLRYSNAYGPRQGNKGEAGVVSVFCRSILNGGQPVINGDGNNTRDFVYVDDIADANLKAIDYEGTATVNISTCKETSINSLFDIINELSGRKLQKNFGMEIKGEQKRSLLDNKLALKLLGWKPMTDIKTGLKNTFEWNKTNQ